MTSKHTPGPWDITWGPSIEIGDGVASVPIRLDGKHTANATLIAAAPELLSALEAMLENYGPPLRSTEYPEWHPISRARAAISKSMGG